MDTRDERSTKADKAVSAILDKSDQMSKHGTADVPVSDTVKATVRALDRERELSEEQLNRRATV